MKGADARRGERGLVLAVEGRRAVVLTPAGEFRRVPLDRPDRRVGEEMPLPAPDGRQWLAALGGLAAAAAVLLAVALSGLRDGRVPGGGAPPLLVQAYVSVDINPSLELGVTAEAAVVEGRPLNEDGRRLLAAVPHRGRPLAQVLADLVREATRAGFLAPGRSGEVVIAAAPAGPGGVSAPVVEAVQRGEVAARAFLRKEGVRAAIYAVRAGRGEVRRQADSLGLSVGKYLVMQELESSGLTLEPEELRKSGLGRLLREHGLEPGDFLRRAVRDQRGLWELIGEEEGGEDGFAGARGPGGPEEEPSLRPADDKGETGEGEEHGRSRPHPGGSGFPGFLGPGERREDGGERSFRRRDAGERIPGRDVQGADSLGGEDGEKEREKERFDGRGNERGRGGLAGPPDGGVPPWVYGDRWAPGGGAWDESRYRTGDTDRQGKQRDGGDENKGERSRKDAEGEREDRREDD